MLHNLESANRSACHPVPQRQAIRQTLANDRSGLAISFPMLLSLLHTLFGSSNNRAHKHSDDHFIKDCIGPTQTQQPMDTVQTPTCQQQFLGITTNPVIAGIYLKQYFI